MGLGKTVITLTALFDLLFDSFEIHKVLVVAPLRVGLISWPDELKKWEHLHFLKSSIVIGTEMERLRALKAKADIYIINRENLEWLVTKSGYKFDFDTVVIDEPSTPSRGNMILLCLSMTMSVRFLKTPAQAITLLKVIVY